MVLCPLGGESGADGPSGSAAQPLVQITIVQQTGGPRGQIYYPYLSFRVSRTLQARSSQADMSHLLFFIFPCRSGCDLEPLSEPALMRCCTFLKQV